MTSSEMSMSCSMNMSSSKKRWQTLPFTMTKARHANLESATPNLDRSSRDIGLGRVRPMTWLPAEKWPPRIQNLWLSCQRLKVRSPKLKQNLKNYSCLATPMMIAMSSWKSKRALAGTNPQFLPATYSGCISGMQSGKAGRPKLSMPPNQRWVAIKMYQWRLSQRELVSQAKLLMQNLNLKVAFTASSESQKPNPRAGSTPQLPGS